MIVLRFVSQKYYTVRGEIISFWFKKEAKLYDNQLIIN